MRTSIYKIFAAFTGKNNSDRLPAASWTWTSNERQQFQDLHIQYSRCHADLRVHNSNIDRLASLKYHISKVKHRYQINRHCKLLNKQKHVVGCCKCDSDKILLTHCNFKSLIWIYRWTRWATLWQRAQSRRVGSLPWNGTRVGSSGLMTTRTANLATVRFEPGSGPEVTVRNRW